MKIQNILIGLLGLVLSLSIFSCKNDDYKIGGDLHDPNVNMSTYDFLKSNRYGMFDTLLLLVDKAGLKEKLNQSNKTFFVPSDYAINKYVLARTLEIQKIDPFKKWTVDSIMKYEMARFADSLNIYFVNQPIVNDDLNAQGKIYKNLKNNEVVVSYEETDDEALGYNSNSSTKPKLVYFTYLYQKLDPNFDVSKIEYPVGTRTLVQTSNVRTTTGTVHVLSNSHTLFYHR